MVSWSVGGCVWAVWALAAQVEPAALLNLGTVTSQHAPGQPLGLVVVTDPMSPDPTETQVSRAVVTALGGQGISAVRVMPDADGSVRNAPLAQEAAVSLEVDQVLVVRVRRGGSGPTQLFATLLTADGEELARQRVLWPTPQDRAALPTQAPRVVGGLAGNGPGQPGAASGPGPRSPEKDATRHARARVLDGHPSGSGALFSAGPLRVVSSLAPGVLLRTPPAPEAAASAAMVGVLVVAALVPAVVAGWVLLVPLAGLTGLAMEQRYPGYPTGWVLVGLPLQAGVGLLPLLGAAGLVGTGLAVAAGMRGRRVPAMAAGLAVWLGGLGGWGAAMAAGGAALVMASAAALVTARVVAADRWVDGATTLEAERSGVALSAPVFLLGAVAAQVVLASGALTAGLGAAAGAGLVMHAWGLAETPDPEAGPVEPSLL